MSNPGTKATFTSIPVALLVAVLAAAAPLLAQPTCADTPVYSPCDLVFELNDEEAAANQNPYETVELHGEFRSPENTTLLMYGFWDGGRRLVVRITPTEPGQWVYRISSNIARLNGQQGSLTAADSDALGFVEVANVRHFAYSTGGVRPPSHLWMGDTSYRFAVMDRAQFERMVDTRAGQKFNHIRGLVLGNSPGFDEALFDDSTPDPDYFRELDSRIRYMNEQGITADLILAGDQNELARRYPTWQERERYVRYVVARYAPMNVTWQGVEKFEEYENPRPLLNEIGQLLKKLDPYQHPRSTDAADTSAPLLADEWMDYIVYQSSDDALLGIEHQLYARPQVDADFGHEDSGAGKADSDDVDTAEFRRRLWRSSMNGAYPTYGNTGTYGGGEREPSAEYLNAPGAEQMTHWYDFFERTRHWELEPFYEVDGGTALALPGVEYIVYVEEPGPVELVVQKKSYKYYWFNPITGEYIKQKKDSEGARFSGEPPSNDHDWVLHLSRDNDKVSMANRWHFESRPVPIQQIELSPSQVPYEIAEPSVDEVLADGEHLEFSAKLTRESRATRKMLYLWTAEVSGSDQGYRVLATGAEGSFGVPPSMVTRDGALLNVRLLGMNAYGKVYSVNRVYKLSR